MSKLGPSFPAELIAAGIGQIAVSWDENGLLFGYDALDPTTQATLDGVIAAHNPALPAPVTSVDFLGFMGLFSPTEQVAVFSSNDVQVKIFITMGASSPVLKLSDPRVIGGVNYLAQIQLIDPSRVDQVLSGIAPTG